MVLGVTSPEVYVPEPRGAFDPERFSPIKPDVILRLPEGNARTFWMASRLDGSFGSTDRPTGFRAPRTQPGRL